MADIFKVSIYIETDNGSRKKLYRGYGAVVEYIKKSGEREPRKISGMCYGTLNLAYILALTESLSLLTKKCVVTIYANNDYVCENICNGRANEWRRNGWHTAKMEPIANTDEWRELFRKASDHELHFVHSNEESRYSEDIQKAIKEVRDKGEYWQQMQLS